MYALLRSLADDPRSRCHPQRLPRDIFGVISAYTAPHTHDGMQHVLVAEHTDEIIGIITVGGQDHIVTRSTGTSRAHIDDGLPMATCGQMRYIKLCIGGVSAGLGYRPRSIWIECNEVVCAVGYVQHYYTNRSSRTVMNFKYIGQPQLRPQKWLPGPCGTCSCVNEHAPLRQCASPGPIIEVWYAGCASRVQYYYGKFGTDMYIIAVHPDDSRYYSRCLWTISTYGDVVVTYSGYITFYNPRTLRRIGRWNNPRNKCWTFTATGNYIYAISHPGGHEIYRLE